MRNIESITQYKTVKFDTISSLDNAVNKYLKKGWKLRGNLIISKESKTYSDGFYTYYNQTITKELR